MYGLVVVGSGPAGVAAARSYRDAGGEGPILLLSADTERPYERPPMSKEILAGASPLELTLIAGEDDPELTGIEVRLASPVDSIDPDAHTVTVGGEHLAYRKLVLATGAEALPLDVADADAGVHLLRSWSDARALVASAEHGRRAIVIGSGFIGCEAAASLRRRGLEVTLLTRSAKPQADRLGDEAASRITTWLEDLGVTIRTGVTITGAAAGGTVTLASGEELQADLVLAALGVRPRVDLATGLDGTAALDVADGRILADDQLRTSAPDVYVAGDVAFAQHAVAGRRLVVEHWDDADRMGGIAGANAAGESRTWTDVPGFWSEIGEHPLQYASWGDGFDEARLAVDDDEGWVIHYGSGGVTVGVLTCNHYDEFDAGVELISKGAPLPS
ncbi:NAD(P)/FAD-dependent oxidoreductase [Propionibacteriaceae bacterium Y2011]